MITLTVLNLKTKTKTTKLFNSVEKARVELEKVESNPKKFKLDGCSFDYEFEKTLLSDYLDFGGKNGNK